MAVGFRIAGTLQEFINDLTVLKGTDHTLIVWQNDANGNKLILEGQYDSYTQEKDKTIINIKLEKNETFEKDNPVYIFEKVKGILFKGRYEFCVNAVLKILADDRVFLKEKRELQRFFFNYSQVDCTIHSKHPDSNDSLEDIVKLRDITSFGFAFKVSNKRSKLFKAGDELKLSSIRGIKLPKPLEGVISHISKFKQKDDEAQMNVVGVKFNTRSKLIDIVINEMKKEGL